MPADCDWRCAVRTSALPPGADLQARPSLSLLLLRGGEFKGGPQRSALQHTPRHSARRWSTHHLTKMLGHERRARAVSGPRPGQPLVQEDRPVPVRHSERHKFVWSFRNVCAETAHVPHTKSFLYRSKTGEAPGVCGCVR